jgi:hypothetical protein
MSHFAPRPASRASLAVQHPLCHQVGYRSPKRGDKLNRRPTNAPLQENRIAGETVMEPNDISIVDIHIPFWRLVMFFVKATIAALPAAIIVCAIYMLVFGGIASVVALVTGGRGHF